MSRQRPGPCTGTEVHGEMWNLDLVGDDWDGLVGLLLKMCQKHGHTNKNDWWMTCDVISQHTYTVIYAYELCIYIYIDVDIYIYRYGYTYIYIYIRIYRCGYIDVDIIYEYIDVDIYIYIQMWIYVCIYVYTDICIYVYIYIYIYISVYTYICIYMHINRIFHYKPSIWGHLSPFPSFQSGPVPGNSHRTPPVTKGPKQLPMKPAMPHSPKD